MTFIDPVNSKDPVITKVSALLENIVDPVGPVKLVEPVTIKDPEIIALPVYGNGDIYPVKYDAVAAYEALTAFNIYDAVCAV
jgi:hypothetical protein